MIYKVLATEGGHDSNCIFCQSDYIGIIVVNQWVISCSDWNFSTSDMLYAFTVLLNCMIQSNFAVSTQKQYEEKWNIICTLLKRQFTEISCSINMNLKVITSEKELSLIIIYHIQNRLISIVMYLTMGLWFVSTDFRLSTNRISTGNCMWWIFLEIRSNCLPIRLL